MSAADVFERFVKFCPITVFGYVLTNKAAAKAFCLKFRFDGARKCPLGLTTPEEVMLMTAESSD